MSIRVFASHDWGKDGANHRKVAQLVPRLRAKGLHVWFDDTHMKGNILDAMCDGIDASDVMIVFLTNNYIKKVRSKDDSDNVRREFLYGIQTLTTDRIVVVRFDSALSSCTSEWRGPVSMLVGNHLYCDMSYDYISNSQVDDLAMKIRQKHMDAPKGLMIKGVNTNSKDVKAAFRKVIVVEKLRAKRTGSPVCRPGTAGTRPTTGTSTTTGTLTTTGTPTPTGVEKIKDKTKDERKDENKDKKAGSRANTPRRARSPRSRTPRRSSSPSRSPSKDKELNHRDRVERLKKAVSRDYRGMHMGEAVDMVLMSIGATVQGEFDQRLERAERGLGIC
jgi:hypothetical protein